MNGINPIPKERLAHTQEELHLLGSDMMRGSGQRVVSAWRHMAAAGCNLLQHEHLFRLIRSDILSNRAGDHGDQPHIAAWVCRPYVNLARSYGAEHWPRVALREYLRQLGEREEMADEVWERELRAYKSEKEFFSGRPWNAPTDPLLAVQRF